MPLIHLAMVLLAYGILLWLIHAYVPAGGNVKAGLSALVVLAACVWVVRAFGLWTTF